MQWIVSWLWSTWELTLDAAPWLLLGLLAAGVIQAFVPAALMSRFLGGRGVGPILKAAFIGAPLPLCSCGVLPAALAVRRQGASRGATVSFLIATPETGVDSIALSYALLGPFFAIARPIAAILSAVFAGILAQFAPEVPVASGAAAATCADRACGCPDETPAPVPDAAGCEDACCGDGCGAGTPAPAAGSRTRRLLGGLRYALTSLLDDLTLWLAVGLLLAGAVAAFLDPHQLAELGHGLPAMLIMLVVGIPMYICATASTPLAAALLLAGLSPGAVLVFLLVGPATNLATLAIVRRELGTPVLVAYLAGIAGAAVGLGLLTDVFIATQGIDIPAQLAETGEFIPYPLALASALVLIFFAIKPLRRVVLR